MKKLPIILTILFAFTSVGLYYLWNKSKNDYNKSYVLNQVLSDFIYYSDFTEEEYSSALDSLYSKPYYILGKSSNTTNNDIYYSRDFLNEPIVHVTYLFDNVSFNNNVSNMDSRENILRDNYYYDQAMEQKGKVVVTKVENGTKYFYPNGFYIIKYNDGVTMFNIDKESEAWKNNNSKLNIEDLKH